MKYKISLQETHHPYFSSSEHHIIDIISGMKASNSSNIGNQLHVINIVALLRVHSLCDIYNKFLEQGLIPNTFKTVIIKPIHKSEPTNKKENYRLIALLSMLSKIMEKIVVKRVINFSKILTYKSAI